MAIQKIIESLPPEAMAAWLDARVAAAGLAAPGVSVAEGEVHPYFFSLFRPQGAQLEAVLPPLHAGVLARLHSLYAATALDWQHAGTTDMYFVVRRTEALSESHQEILAETWLRNLEALSAELQEPLDFSQVQVVVRAELPPETVDMTDAEDGIYELTGQVLEMLEPEDGFEALLEPLYYTTCQTALSAWVIWPVLAADFRVPEPFAPWFELWRKGYELVWENETTLAVYRGNESSV